MVNVTKAIYSYFSTATTDPFYTGLTGRLYPVDDAPQNATDPYATFGIISEVPDDTFSGEISNALIQFRIFSSASSRLVCEELLDECMDLYHLAIIQPTSGYCDFKMIRNNVIYPFKNEKGDWADWQAMIDFNATIQKG